jgi:hypothetical protein
MECRKAQLIAVGSEGLQSIRLCLSNDSDASETVELELHAVKHIWDYRVKTGARLKNGSVEIAPGEKQWISWNVDLSASDLPDAGSYVRIDLMANPKLRWHVAGCVLPGHVGYYQIGENKYRRFGNGVTLSFETVPPQSCFAAAQVAGGATRPHAKTNLWCSDPQQPLPQSLEWSWDEPKSVAQIELTFPGHLLREYHAYAPFYADPQCPRSYRIEAEVNGQWQVVAERTGNVQRRQVHHVEPVSSSRFRLVILETNGDPSAQVYEVRCYAEAE